MIVLINKQNNSCFCFTTKTAVYETIKDFDIDPKYFNLLNKFIETERYKCYVSEVIKPAKKREAGKRSKMSNIVKNGKV